MSLGHPGFIMYITSVVFLISTTVVLTRYLRGS